MSCVIAAAAVGIDRFVDPAAASSQSSGSPGSPVLVSEVLMRASVDPEAPTGELAAGWNDAGFDLLGTSSAIPIHAAPAMLQCPSRSRT